MADLLSLLPRDNHDAQGADHKRPVKQRRRSVKLPVVKVTGENQWQALCKTSATVMLGFVRGLAIGSECTVPNADQLPAAGFLARERVSCDTCNFMSGCS